MLLKLFIQYIANNFVFFPLQLATCNRSFFHPYATLGMIQKKNLINCFLTPEMP